MGATGISEFTFGYAFLYEQTQRNWTNLKAVPILPSLQQEANLGWDAHLPTQAADFYYQFKLSDYLERPYRSTSRTERTPRHTTGSRFTDVTTIANMLA